MLRHPTVPVPNQGPMDHAWDVLGEWVVELDLPDRELPLTGTLNFTTWDEAEFALDPSGPSDTGLPEKIQLARASDVHRTDAGGGALQWLQLASEERWALQTTLWPGAMHILVVDADDDESQLCIARAKRTSAYYRRKYPAGQG